MSTNFPTTLDAYARPSASDTMNSPSHAGVHDNAYDAIEATEAKLGIGSSPAASATEGQVLVKTATAGTTIYSDVPTNHSMARQAIINGNFDVWQRGTTTPATSAGFIADRWIHDLGVDGGTDPTFTHTRQLLTSGDIPNAYYYYQIATNGSGSNYGNSSFHDLGQKIEHGTRLLCGLNKKVTLSFWAKTTISGTKRLGLSLLQVYGTGGSPSTSEIIKGGKITLTSTWTKYTVTFTTNTLVGKTFGTANDDYLYPLFFTQWGTTIGNNWIETSITAESFVGAGNICIAQVQLCAGDVALPFQPKSFEDELRACQRYCWVISSSLTFGSLAFGVVESATRAFFQLQPPVKMRTQPNTVTLTAGLVLRSAGSSFDITANQGAYVTDSTSNFILDVASGLTVGHAVQLINPDTTTRTLMMEAEL